MAVTSQMLRSQKNKLKSIIELAPKEILEGKDSSAAIIKPEESKELLSYLSPRFGNLAKYTMYLLLFFLAGYILVNNKVSSILSDPLNVFSVMYNEPVTQIAGIYDTSLIQFYKWYLATFSIRKHFFPNAKDLQNYNGIVNKFKSLAQTQHKYDYQDYTNSGVVLESIKRNYIESNFDISFLYDNFGFENPNEEYLDSLRKNIGASIGLKDDKPYEKIKALRSDWIVFLLNHMITFFKK